MSYRKQVCTQVLKNIVDRIERREKDALRKIKKQELEDEKQKKLIAAKLQGTLFKHKEMVKKEILKKRALMERNLQQEIQVCSKKKKKYLCSALHVDSKINNLRMI